jgi:hypothetical protein
MTSNDRLLTEIQDIKVAVARIEERLKHLEKPTTMALLSGGTGSLMVLLCQYVLQQMGMLP